MRARRFRTRASTRMETIVASGIRPCKQTNCWVAIGGFGDCDFRDNRVGHNSYFDEADMNSQAKRGEEKGRMSKVRINDLARELEVKSKAILDALPHVGVTEKKTHSSSLEEHEAVKVRAYVRGSAESQGSSARSARSPRGEEEIKTKIDLS